MPFLNGVTVIAIVLISIHIHLRDGCKTISTIFNFLTVGINYRFCRQYPQLLAFRT